MVVIKQKPCGFNINFFCSNNYSHKDLIINELFGYIKIYEER